MKKNILLVLANKNMTKCAVHNDFFDDECIVCKKEYNEMKGGDDNNISNSNIEDNENIANNDKEQHKKKIYKEFTEERAKKLYEELLFQYLKTSTEANEAEAAEKARAIIRKQCRIRGMPLWPWL